MSVLDIPLRKILQLFYAEQKLRRSILKNDIRLDLKKEAGGTRSQGGDFYLPFWSYVKKHISDVGDLRDLTDARVESNKNFKRLYPLLRDGTPPHRSTDLQTTSLRGPGGAAVACRLK